jgi:hypothetical protein
MNARTLAYQSRRSAESGREDRTPSSRTRCERTGAPTICEPPPSLSRSPLPGAPGRRDTPARWPASTPLPQDETPLLAERCKKDLCDLLDQVVDERLGVREVVEYDAVQLWPDGQPIISHPLVEPPSAPQQRPCCHVMAECRQQVGFLYLRKRN